MGRHPCSYLRNSHQYSAIRSSDPCTGLGYSSCPCALPLSCVHCELCCCNFDVYDREREAENLTAERFIITPIKTLRDVLVFSLDRNRVMVVGCDSSGGIGPKRLDAVKVDGHTLGKFTARVALMEVLSTGARPVCLVNTLSVEPKPTGLKILQGIREEARRAGLRPKLAITGTSEKNIPVQQTGLGVTVIGIAKRNQLRIGLSKKRNVVVSVGIPLVGKGVLSGERKGLVADTTDLLRLLNLDFVNEVIPVGSHGILHEAETIAEESHLKFQLTQRLKVDVRKSAGPATVVLATLPERRLQKVHNKIDKPTNIIGQFL